MTVFSSLNIFFRLALFGGFILAISACNPQEDTTGNSAEQTKPVRDGMLSNREIFGWVQDIVSFGSRRTGSEAGIKTAGYIAEQFKSFGLENVTIEQGDALQWEATNWSLSVNGVSIPCFYMPRSFHPKDGQPAAFSTGPSGLQREVVYVGDRIDFDDIDIRDKIVVADVLLKDIDLGLMKLAANKVYDPEGTLSLFGKSHVDPFSPNNYPRNLINAMDQGAAGFVGILANYIDSNNFHNEDIAYMIRADAYLELPGLWVSRTEGEKIKALIQSANKPTHGVLRLSGELKTVTYNTVLGYLSGSRDETLMIQSHHDSAFSGAVEDASGSAEVLALAKYYSQKPSAERNRRMMFVTMDTHFTEYESHEDFVEKYVKGSENKNIVANLTIEHIALEMLEEDGKPLMTGQVEPRLFIVSDNEKLLELTNNTISGNDYQRALTIRGSLFNDDVIEDGIPTDADMIYRAGIPVISLVTAPLYLYDMMDTLDKVAVEELQPTAIVFADLIDNLDVMPTSDLQIQGQ